MSYLRYGSSEHCRSIQASRMSCCGLNTYTLLKEKKMPIQKYKSGYKVKGTKTKKPLTKTKAKAQQSAIYANKSKKK